MSKIEVALTDLGEISTRELTKELNKTVIMNKNNLKYKYIDEDKLLEKIK